MPAISTPSSCSISSVTAANTSSGAAPRATRVATRRSAACSSASRPSGPALGVGERGRDQFGERRQARLGARWQWLLPGRADADDAPQAPLDDDRRPDRRADARLASGGSERAGRIGVAVDPGRTPGLEDERAELVPLKVSPAADRELLGSTAPGAEEREHAAGLVAGHGHQVGRKQLPGLLGDRREHFLRCRPARHQGRDPPQRGLLVGQLGQGGPALGVRDRRRHQFGERRQPRLAVRRQELLPAGPGGDHAPEAALGDDRRRDRRADASLDGRRTERARGPVSVAVDPGRTAGLEHDRAEVVPTERPPAAHWKPLARTVPGGEEGERPVGLVAAHVDHIDRKQLTDLPGHRRKHLFRRGPSRDQRRDPPQRRLLLGQPAHPGSLRPGSR